MQQDANTVRTTQHAAFIDRALDFVDPAAAHPADDNAIERKHDAGYVVGNAKIRHRIDGAEHTALRHTAEEMTATRSC